MILRNGHIECFKVNTNAGVLPPIAAKIGKEFEPFEFDRPLGKDQVVFLGAAAGLSGGVRGCRGAVQRACGGS